MRGFGQTIKAMAIGLALCGSSVLAAQVYSWKSVVVGGGGFVDGFVFHPTVKGLMYARTDMGGAYRWNPAFGSWTPITDWIGAASDNMGILSIALDPNDGSKVYLLTGKYSNSWSSAPGCVLISSDTGKTFSQTALHLKNGGNLDGRGAGERLAVDPNLGSVLVLAGSGWDTANSGAFVGRFRGAIWKSTDGGKTFDSLKTAPNGNGFFALFDPASGTKGTASKDIYVGVDSSDAGKPAIWHSPDGGATWAKLPGQPTGFRATSARISGDDIYFAMNDGVTPNDVKAGQLWRYSIKGGTWTNVSPATGTFGFGTPSVSGQNPSMLVVSSMDKWNGGDDVWISHDRGANWTATLSTGTLDISWAPWKKIRSPHWLASVQMDPFDSTNVLFGTGYGVFRTKNLFAAKPTWFAADSNLEETVAQQLVSPPVGAPLLSAMGDQGGFRHARLDKAPEAPHMPDVGTTLAIDVAWQAPNIFVKAHNAANSKGTVGGYSTDSGKTWIGFAANPAGVSVPSAANNWAGGGGTRSITVSADGSSFVWTAPGTAGAYYSKDKGATWTKSTSPAITATTAWPTADRVNPKKIYVLDPQSGTLLVSSDAGATFAAGGSFLKLDGWEAGNAAIATVPGYEGALLVAADHAWGGGGLYISTNSGTTLTKLAGVASATQVAVGKAAPGKTFPAIYINGKIGSVSGFFRSDDSAKTWTRINDDQHQFGTIHQLVGDMNVYSRLYLATEGRGIVYGEVPGGNTAIAPSRMVVSLHRLGNAILGSSKTGIVLTDVRGREIRVSENVNGVARLDLSGLPHGLYVARSGSEGMAVDLVR